jgi:hypothetical protein
MTSETIRTPRAVLIADIGSAITRVTLVDAVEGEARMLGQAEVLSSVELPAEDAGAAVLEAAALVAEQTGRLLLDGDTLRMPQDSERNGVDSVVVVTSAAGPLALVIAAVSSDISARSAAHAARATYSSILQVVTLNESDRGERGFDNAWIERQVQTLVGLRPDVVLIAGGLEGGAEDPLARLAHIVGLALGATGAPRDTPPRPVIFAGNSAARERVVEALSGRAAPVVVENLRPALEQERLEPARRELNRIYTERMLARVPGLPALRRLARGHVHTGTEADGLATRFIAARYQRDVLTLDIGSASTAAYLASQGRYSPAVLGGIGSGYGLGGVLAARGPAAIARWLPFAISEAELTHRLLNRLLRPLTFAVTGDDVLIEQAVAREALSMALEALWDERPGAPYTMVVARGGVLAHAPHPGYAALTILDALQPGADDSVLATMLHLDTLGLWTAAGALAYADADAAMTLFERDVLRNTPLATCVATLGGGRPGEPAVEAELRVVGGDSATITVCHGQIGRLPLPPGRKAQLVLRPAPGVRIGRNPPGAEVPSDLAAVTGSALGVIIDARGRPLRLPDDPAARRQAIWDALVALGAVQGPPAASAAVPEAPATPLAASPAEEAAPAPAPAGPRRISLSPPPAPAAPDAISSDLARLRETVEEAPAKKGFFRRK